MASPDQPRAAFNFVSSPIAESASSNSPSQVEASTALSSDIEPAAAVVARRVYRQRRLRARFFLEELFRDPAWDMLLDLYVAASEHKSISVCSACGAAGTPVATGLRWLARLEREGLVLRSAPGTDGRLVHVELTLDARQKMTGLLTRFAAEG